MGDWAFPVGRRSVLVAGAAAVLGSCAGPGSPAPTGSPSRGTASGVAGSAATSRTGAAQLPSPRPWLPGPGELEPAAKAAAVRHVEAMDTSTHRVEVIDAQYGGLLATTASVLVVGRSWTLRGGRLTEGGHTFDVRLTFAGSSWRVTAVHPSRPGRRSGSLSSAARHVLASDRITLPPAARADIGSGQVHDSVLEAMLRVSRRWRVGVSVVRSGHPLYVFGTSRPSDHPQGRAFDTWLIDGHPVVRPGTPRALITDYMEALAVAGSYNVGGPVLLGAAPQWFSDRTHHDHVHAGFTT